MKLRKIKTLAVGFAMATFALIQFGCEADWMKEYSSSKMLDANTATVSVNTIKDSTAMLNYSISTVGRLFVVVVPGDDDTATPDSQGVLKLTTSNAVFTKQIVLSDAGSLSGSVKAAGLEQNTSYKVFVLPVNSDGVLGDIVTTDAFTTSDNYAPELDLTSGISPAISSSAAQTTTFSVKLTFNETVVLADAPVIQIGYRNAVTGTITYVDVPKANISVASKVVTITQPQVAINGQYLFLSIGANSIKDRSNNYFEGVTSGIVSGYLSGIYWRVKFAATEAQMVYPTEEVTSNTAMNIVLDFPIKMRFPSSSETAYDQTKVVVRYTSGGSTTYVQVPQANVSIVQDTLVQIVLPRTPIYGETISFMMAEGMLRNSYGNPCAAVDYGDYSWLMSYNYTRDLIIGTYNVHCVSTFNSNEYDFTVTIAAKSGSANKVVITGLENSTSPVEGVFDGDFATLTIAQDQSLGDLLGDGSEVFVFSNTSDSGDILGSIQSNGNMTMDWASYIVGGTYDGYYYDRYYGSVWTKTTKGTSSFVKKNFVPVLKVK